MLFQVGNTTFLLTGLTQTNFMHCERFFLFRQEYLLNLIIIADVRFLLLWKYVIDLCHPLPAVKLIQNLSYKLQFGDNVLLQEHSNTTKRKGDYV